MITVIFIIAIIGGAIGSWFITPTWLSIEKHGTPDTKVIKWHDDGQDFVKEESDLVQIYSSKEGYCIGRYEKIEYEYNDQVKWVWNCPNVGWIEDVVAWKPFKKYKYE